MRRNRVPALQHNVARQVLVLTTQPIATPRPRTGMAHEREPTVHRKVGLSVLVDRGRHRTHNRQLISHLANLRKHTADRQTTLATFLELKRTGHHIAVLVELSALNLHRHRLPV